MKAILNITVASKRCCAPFLCRRARCAFFSPLLRRDDSSLACPERQITVELQTNEVVPGASVAIVTLNRAKAANSMGKEMLHQLKQGFDFLETELSSARDDTLKHSLRCLIITSSSPKVFSAGADLKERAIMTIEEAELFVNDLRMTFDRLAKFSIPSIAAIEGVAVGGGLELAMAADLRVASETSLMGLPETSLAIVPGAGGTQRLPRLIGMARAKELIWTAQRINGMRALEYGLVQHVTESGKALNTALDIAWKIARNGPIAIDAAKFAIEKGLQVNDVSHALDVERQAYARVLTSMDRLEGLAAFKEGRAPVYKGQ